MKITPEQKRKAILKIAKAIRDKKINRLINFIFVDLLYGKVQGH